MNIFEKRIRHEFKIACKNNKKDDKIFVLYPDENDLHIWYALFFKLDKPFDNGEYIIQFNLPEEYPMKSPVVKFLTPNGRYQENVNVCIYGITHYHEEANNAATDICSMVNGVISTLYSFEAGIGSINTGEETKKIFANTSIVYNDVHNKKIYSLLNKFR